MIRTTVILKVLFCLLIVTAFSSEVSAQENDSFPVPTLGSDSSENQRHQAERLRRAYANMRKVLCEKPNPPTPAWDNLFFDHFKEIVVAQHTLVWSLTGPLDKDEEVHRLEDPEPAIRTALTAAINAAPAGQRGELNRRLNKINKGHTDFQEAAGSPTENQSALKISAIKAYFALVEKEFPPSKMRELRILANYQRMRGDALQWIDNVRGRVYGRTITNIAGKMSPEAGIFSLYRYTEFTATQHDQIRDQVMRESAQMLPSLTPVSVAEFVKLPDEKWRQSVAEFSEPAQENIRGGCGRSVQVRYDREREADAKKAEELLKQSGYLPKLQLSAYDRDRFRGRLYHRLTGEEEERSAARLVGILRSVDELVAEARPSSSQPDYELYLRVKGACGSRVTAKSITGGNVGSTPLPIERITPTTGTINTNLPTFDDGNTLEIVMVVSAGEFQYSFEVKDGTGKVVGSEQAVLGTQKFSYCIPFKKGDVITVTSIPVARAGQVVRGTSIGWSVYLAR